MRVPSPIRVALSAVVVVLLFAGSWAAAADTAADPEPPFVICEDQRYALCASASCFVYNGVAYCGCDVKDGNSISLQLSFSTSTGEKNVCDLNAEGVGNGFMVSTYSVPPQIVKGRTAAVYTCPGTGNAGTGVPAPVAYGQCDGGLCFTSTINAAFPDVGRTSRREIACSCPISTGATAGSSTGLGYQVIGPYHPRAPIGKRCDPSGCAPCNVQNPTANGSVIPVGSPTGSGRFLSERLTGSVPSLNECLCECPANGGPCTLREEITP
jgi:hypothetical protein